MNKQALSVVLIPGFMLDESLWDETIEEYPKNWQIYKANLLQGNSIKEIAQYIAHDSPSKFILIGFSLGGYVARSLVEQFPEKVSALILIASSLRPDTPEQKKLKLASIKANSQRTFRGLSSKAIAKTLHPLHAQNKILISRIQNMGRKIGYDAFVNQSLLCRNDNAVDKIKCPTLIIAGAQDLMRSQEEATELCNAIPNASFKLIENTGHMIPIEQPKELVTTILQWLNTIHLN